MSRDSLIKVLWGQNRGMTLLLLALLLANLGTYLIQTRFLDRQLSGLRSEVLERQQSLRRLQQQKNIGSMPVSALNRVEGELTRFQKLIPPEHELSAFIGELFRYAGSTQLDIKQISYSPERDAESGLLSYDLKFSVSGRYRQLKHFVHLLEGAQRILIISNIGLSGGEERKDQDAEVTLQIQLKTFFRGDES
jgi:Tfp pilus assembly protein PilO